MTIITENIIYLTVSKVERLPYLYYPFRLHFYPIKKGYALVISHLNIAISIQSLFSSLEFSFNYIPVYYVPECTDVIWTTVLVV